MVAAATVADLSTKHVFFYPYGCVVFWGLEPGHWQLVRPAQRGRFLRCPGLLPKLLLQERKEVVCLQHHAGADARHLPAKLPHFLRVTLRARDILAARLAEPRLVEARQVLLVRDQPRPVPRTIPGSATVRYLGRLSAPEWAQGTPCRCYKLRGWSHIRLGVEPSRRDAETFQVCWNGLYAPLGGPELLWAARRRHACRRDEGVRMVLQAQTQRMSMASSLDSCRAGSHEIPCSEEAPGVLLGPTPHQVVLPPLYDAPSQHPALNHPP